MKKADLWVGFFVWVNSASGKKAWLNNLERSMAG
jgi:hypothetical protein